MRVKVINKRPASVLQMKRVCAYARVSTDSRRQEDSLENQMETYERLITGNPEYEFIGVFADQGISGYCENRPQFQRMMEKARAGEIDLIITKSISRFARNTVTVLKFAIKNTKGIFICRSITPLKTKETIQGKTMGKCRVITFRKITSQLYRRRYWKRCRKSGNSGSVTGILDRTAQWSSKTAIP